MTSCLLNTLLLDHTSVSHGLGGEDDNICQTVGSMDSQNAVKCSLFIKMQKLSSIHRVFEKYIEDVEICEDKPRGKRQSDFEST